MILPKDPVTLTPDTIAKLNRALTDARHDINNNLCLLTAAAELLRLRPEMAERLAPGLLDQPPKIIERIRTFSAIWEQAMGITRP